MIVGKMNGGRMALLALVLGLGALSLSEGKPLPKKPVTDMPEDLRKDVEKAWCNESRFANKKKCDRMYISYSSIHHCFADKMTFFFEYKRNGTLNDYDPIKLGEMLSSIRCDGSDATQTPNEFAPTTQKNTQTVATSTVSPIPAVTSGVPEIDSTPPATENPVVAYTSSTSNPVEDSSTSTSLQDSGTTSVQSSGSTIPVQGGGTTTPVQGGGTTPVQGSGTSTSVQDSGTSTPTPATVEEPEDLTTTAGEGNENENSPLFWIIPVVLVLLGCMAAIGFLVHRRVKKSGYLRSTPTKANSANGHSEKEKEANGEKEARD